MRETSNCLGCGCLICMFILLLAVVNFIMVITSLV